MHLFGVQGGEEENQQHSKDLATSSAACEWDAVQLSGSRGRKQGGRCPEDKESSWRLTAQFNAVRLVAQHILAKTHLDMVQLCWLYYLDPDPTRIMVGA